MPGTALPGVLRSLQSAAFSGAASFQGVWAAATSYAIGAMVTAADGHVYISKVNNNINHNPTAAGSPAQWQAAAS